ncbi:RHS repeat-associated core domain-containing protein [Corallococcus sp. EGB]|uniref:RHS repeat-associated core domain-containing protein n=1 Tax=Corallococcus sp. EGB TaxID=1521117 RepID=UPI001CBCFADC|nr:RHS repeat-associated core domain-containing protein [Corallococcus sp. EGB]
MRGVWLWGALALTVVMGCGKKQDAPAASGTPSAAVARSQAPLAPALVQACAPVEPVTTNPSWRGGTLVVAGGAQGSAQIPGSEGEPALVVVQNGNGTGQNTVQSAQVTLNGATVLMLAPGTPIAVRRVVLGSPNLLQVSATGGGEVRASVAALTNLPCGIVNVVAQVGSPPVEEPSFSRKSVETLAILMVDLTGEDTTAEVLLNGVDMLANVPAAEQRTFVALVPVLAEGNSLKVTVQGSSGGSARAALFDADVMPPSLTLSEPEPGSYFTTSPVYFSGKFGMDTKGVLINGQQASLVGHDGFHTAVPLDEGINAVTTTISDTCGNTARQCIPVVLDSASPVIAFSGVTEGLVTADPVTPEFSVTGGEAPVVVTATLNGESFQSGTEVSRHGDFDLRVRAEDAQGRAAIQHLHFAVLTEAPTVVVTGVEHGQVYPGPVNISVAVTSSHVDVFQVSLNGENFDNGVVSTPGEYVLSILARDSLYHYNVQLIRFFIDPPPVLTLVSPLADAVTDQGQIELVVHATDNGSVTNVELGETSFVLGEDGNHRLTVSLVEGSNVLQVVAYDDRGSRTTLAVHLVLDTVKPVLKVTSPVDNALVSAEVVTVSGTVHDATPVTLTVNGQAVTPDAQGAFSTQVPLVNGVNTVTVTATDAAGNDTSISRTVTRSSALPTLVVTDPPDGYAFTESSVTVRGEASTPNPSDTPVVTVNDAPVVVHEDGTFAHVLSVPVGDQTVVVRVTAPDGASVERMLLLHRMSSASDAGIPPGQDAGTQPSQDGGAQGPQDGGTAPGDAGIPFDLDAGASELQPAPTLVVTSPDDGAVLGGARFAVSGQVEGGELPLQVTVNGFAAAVTGRYFNASLGLLEGPQTVTVEVKDSRGRVASSVRQVSVDRTMPSLSIQAPSTNPATVTQSPFVLKGTAGDTNLARVTVDGVPVTLIAGSFAWPVSLHAGSNTFVIVAEDLAGNRRVRTQVLNIASVPPQVTVLSPADGTEATSDEIDVRVQVSGGTEPVTVAIGSLTATKEPSGVYSQKVTLALGANTIEVRATDANGLTGTASVGVRYRDVEQEPLAVTGVSPASGTTGVETDALVSVAFNKPVDAATVASHFEVRARGSKLEGGYAVAPGGQTVTFVAREALPAGERVQVRVQGAEAAQGPDQSSAFASEFTVRRPLTVVRGVVLDERQFPLSGVKVEVEGQAGQSTRTGPDGNWALIGVRGGQQVVMRYEGGATSDGRSLPTVRRQLFVTAEQETQDRPLMLFPVDGASAQPVSGATGGTLTFNGAQDALSMIVPAGGLAFAGGSTEGMLTVTELPPHGRPVPMEDRAGVAALWQLGPERVQFLKPVTLTLPNRTKVATGRMVVLVAFDERRLALKRVGFAHAVSEAVIESDGPVASASFEFFGYMEITPAQQLQVEAALAQAGGSSGGGTTGGGGSATDGGLGLRLRRNERPSLWQEVASYILATAHAQGLLSIVPLGLSAMDSFPGGTAHAWGVVRAPAEDETRLELRAPAEATLGQSVEVDLPYTQNIGFVARYEANSALAAPGGESVTAALSGVSPDGTPLAPGAGETWTVEHANEATLTTSVTLAPGTTTLVLRGATRFDTRAIELKATLTPLPADGGMPKRATLVLQRSEVSSEGEQDPLHGAARFQGVRVDITSANDTAAMTSESGRYSTLLQVPAPNTQSIACADIPLGPRFVARLDAEGNTRFDSVDSSFSSCSPMFWLYPGATTRADVLVDVRLLHGAITFKQKDGQPLPAVCSGVTQTQRDPQTGEVRQLSEADVATTEVHFFREGDLEHPLARYAVTRPSVQECPDAANPPRLSQGKYSRLRLGPTNSVSRATRTRCEQLQTEGAKTVEERLFLKNECSDSNSAFLRLSEGDRLVVFAINHATGYSGMATVTVPSINRNARVNGTCAADANGPLQIQEGDKTFSISHCTQQELGIPGDVDLYPPEIDVRVQRRAQDDGVAQAAKKHLIRTGGAGTTRDDYVQVVTRWRVRRQKQLATEPGTGAADGGVAQGDCVRGLHADGGSCAPGLLTDDDADAGVPLEMYCSELPPGASALQAASCLQDDQELADVPTGVPPLAGQIIRVTGSAVEQPAVTTFAVAPGQHTVHVDAALRRVNGNGKTETVNSLLTANYYLHVVGSRLLERDQDGDGWVSRAEDVAKPPHFEEQPPPTTNPPGLPAQAIVLKNVFKRYDAKGVLSDQYDVAREHEFRILDLKPTRLDATGDGSTRDLMDLPKEDEPAAAERDLAYDFLAQLLAPTDPGRAGTLSGDYRVRLGSDAFGIDCPLKVDAQAHTLVASCGGEYIAEVLSASDILYLELYLSGNAENVLYRFNLFGLASRKDVLAASTEHLAEAAVMPDATDGTAAIGRQVGRPAMSTFFVEPDQLGAGVVKVCLSKECESSNGNLLKEALLSVGADGMLQVTDTKRGRVREQLQLSPQPSATGARRFQLALPADLASMPGTPQKTKTVYLVTESAASLAAGERTVTALGKPEGSYNAANARAVGQSSVSGISSSDGHLSFSHDDFAVPFLGSSFGFSRTYNNQDNEYAPVGIGWHHNFEGYVREERFGRYVAVVNGQAYSFPGCATPPENQPTQRGNASDCTTDNTHGFKLTVTAPVNMSGGDAVTLTTPRGEKFEFNRRAMGAADEGKRRWLLTRFGDSHARGDDKGWTKIDYLPSSDLVSSVTRKGETTQVQLAFGYEAVDLQAPGVSPLLRLAVRSQGFQWLKTVTLTGGEGGTYTSTFTRDGVGNLTRVVRTPGAPYLIYTYEYEPVPQSLGATDRWAALNELSVARRIHGNAVEAVGPVQYAARYFRQSPGAPHPHVSKQEVVSAVQETGMAGTLSMTYGAKGQRTVTRPDAVQVQLQLNTSNNLSSSQTLLALTKQQWPSDMKGQPVVLSQTESPTGRVMNMTSNTSLQLTDAVLTKGPEGSLPVAGLGSDRKLVHFDLDPRFGLPTTSTVKVGQGSATISSPRNAAGDLMGLTLANVEGSKPVFQAQEYDPDGLLKTFTDAQGRKVSNKDFNGLGQAKTTETKLEGATGLDTLTQTLTFDAYGRVLRSEETETGVFEAWTYDGLGRVLSVERSGTPKENWTYTYTETESPEGTLVLTVTETLAQADAQNGGTTSAHLRVTTYEDGLLKSESVRVGNPVRMATTTYAYENGQLKSTTDATGHVHVNVYDLEGRLERVTVDGLTEVEYQLDAEGRPLAIWDSLRHQTKIDYDEAGRAVSWDYGDGDTESVLLDAQGNPMRQVLGGTAANQALVMSRLDAMGRPGKTDSVRANGAVHEVRLYDNAGRLTRVEDAELGLVEVMEYSDVLGRLTRTTRTVGTSNARTRTLVETRTYDDAQHLVTVARTIETENGPRTESQTLLMDTAGRVLETRRQVDGQLAVDVYRYTERGDMYWHVSPENEVTRSTYDAAGNLLKVEDPEHFIKTYERDNEGRVEVEKGPHPGYQSTLTYDGLGRPLSRTVAAYGSTPQMQWTYGYLPISHETVETAVLGTDKNIVTTRRHNARGRLVKETVTGHNVNRELTVAWEGPWEKSRKVTEGSDWTATTTYGSRDDRGRVLAQAESWSADSASYLYETTTAWVKRKATMTSVDTAGGKTDTWTSEIEVDSLGNVVSLKQDRDTDVWDYDAAGALTKQQKAGLLATTYSYVNGLLKTENFDTVPTVYSYDRAGRVTRQDHPDGRQTQTFYNSRGLKWRVKYGRSTNWETTDYTYDANGQPLTVTYGVDAQAPETPQTWTYARGAQGELLGAQPPGLGMFEYRYDGLLRLTSVTPPAGSPTAAQTFGYDALGRQVLRTRGTSQWLTMWDNGVSTQVDANQDTVVTLMDGRGRPARVSYQPGTASAANTQLTKVALAYTAADQPWLVAETQGTQTLVNDYEYNARRLLKRQSRDSDTVSFTYTASGLRWTVTSSAGEVAYGYDSRGRLHTATGPAGETTFDWEPGGARLQSVIGGGLVERRCYDDRGRLSAVLNAGDDAVCNELESAQQLKSLFKYSYDVRGNRTQEDYWDAPGAMVKRTTYGYDGADRLTGVKYDDGKAVLYKLAQDGTRLEEKETALGYAGPLTPDGFDKAVAQRHWRYTHDPRGGLESILNELDPNPDPTQRRLATYVTDPVGRVTSEQRGSGGKTYGWDVAGRLTQVTVAPEVPGESSSVTTQYQYGWDGLRVERTTGAQTVAYLWAGGALVEERLAGQPALLYTQGGSMAVAVGAERIAHDGLGSAVGRYTASGSGAQHRYDVWGRYRDDTAPSSTQAGVGFTGHAWDDDVGLAYAQQRWYDPAVGRFLSADPIVAGAYLATPTELNAWMYARGNPLMFIDPTGEATRCAQYGPDAELDSRICAARSAQAWQTANMLAAQRQNDAGAARMHGFLRAAAAEYEEDVVNNKHLERDVVRPTLSALGLMVVGHYAAPLIPAAAHPWISRVMFVSGLVNVGEAIRGEEKISISPVRALFERSTKNLVVVEKFESQPHRYAHGFLGAFDLVGGFLGRGVRSTRQVIPLSEDAVPQIAPRSENALGSLREYYSGSGNVWDSRFNPPPDLRMGGAPVKTPGAGFGTVTGRFFMGKAGPHFTWILRFGDKWREVHLIQLENGETVVRDFNPKTDKIKLKEYGEPITVPDGQALLDAAEALVNGGKRGPLVLGGAKINSCASIGCLLIEAGGGVVPLHRSQWRSHVYGMFKETPTPR